MLEGPIKVLLVEDDPDEVLLIGEAINDTGATDITVLNAETLQAALGMLADETFDAVLLDLSLPDSFGIDSVVPVTKAAGKVPVIVCTGLNDEKVGQDAIRSGAQDFLVKNPRLYGAIPRILRYAVERNRLIQSANKKVELAREYTELLLTKVVAIANAGLGIANREGTFSLVNPALAELVGCSTADLVGVPWTNLLVENDRKVEMEHYKESFDTFDTYNRAQLSLQCKDGATIEVPMRSVLVEFGENRLCRVLSFGSPANAKASPNAAFGGDTFSETLSFRVANGGATLTMCRLQLNGLRNTKHRLGEHWQPIEERVAALAANTIAAHLSPGDSFERDQNGDFVIYFDQLGEQEARLKARAIAEEIRNKTVASGDRGEFADFDLNASTLSNIAELAADAYAIQLAPGEFGAPQETLSLISRKLDDAVARAKTNTKLILAEVRKSCRSSLRETHQRNGRGLSLMMHDFDPDTRQRIIQLKNKVNDRAESLAEIDCVALGSAAECIYKFNGSKVPLIAVNAHYSTLANKELFANYVAVCQRLTEPAVQSLVFNIRDLPRNIRQRQLTSIARSIGPYSRFQMIQVTDLDLGDLDLSEAAIRLIAIDYENLLASYVRDPSKCREIVGNIRSAGARTVVDRVTTRESGFLFRELGVDLVCYERLS